MIGRILQFVLGVVVFFFSTLQGMANETIQEEVRADFFEDSFLNDDGGKQKAVSFDDLALMQFSEGEGEAESSFDSDGEDEAKRHGKRTVSFHKFISKCHFSNCLSAKSLARGEARHPETQDVRQQRTETIRFLQISALNWPQAAEIRNL